MLGQRCNVTRSSTGFRKPRRKHRAGKCFHFICACWMPRRPDLSDAEAATILFPDATNVYPDYDGKKKVSNARQSAKRLQRDYLFVACAQPKYLHPAI